MDSYTTHRSLPPHAAQVFCFRVGRCCTRGGRGISLWHALYMYIRLPGQRLPYRPGMAQRGFTAAPFPFPERARPQRPTGSEGSLVLQDQGAGRQRMICKVWMGR